MPGTDNENTVKSIGVSENMFKFGGDSSDQLATLSGRGAFLDATSERIFEESGRGILASL